MLIFQYSRVYTFFEFTYREKLVIKSGIIGALCKQALLRLVKFSPSPQDMIITELQISDDFGKQLQLIASRQIPFAVALALTRTAQDSQRNVRSHISENFTIRKKSGGFANSIAIRPATKQNLNAEVYTMARFAALQQTGGTRQPDGSGKLAVPLYNSLKEVKLNRGAKRLSDAFTMTLSGGKHVIARREGKNLRILYHLKSEAKVPKRFFMIESVMRTVGDRFEEHFEL